MKTAIIYASSRGTTEKAAEMLKGKIDGEVTLINAKKVKELNLANYDSVILGSSIHAGMVQGKIKKLLELHQEELKTKRIGLFICCMNEGEKALQQFNLAYPEFLRNQAVATGLFGGEFDFSKMNFFEKMIIKMMDNKATDISTLSEDEIANFAKKFNHHGI